MNMQALMKQAQAMQKEISVAKEEINNTNFEGVSSLITVVVNGNKEILKVTLSPEIKDAIDDLSMIEDMIALAIKDAFVKVDKMTEEKLGKYANMMSGIM